MFSEKQIYATINEKYVNMRNLCNKICKNEQRQHILSVENEDPARVWKFPRTLGMGQSHHESISKKIKINLFNNNIYKNNKILKTLNKHFSSDINNNTKANTLKNISPTLIPNYSPFFFNQLFACDVRMIILAISSNEGGSDCISRNTILPIVNEMLHILCNILNHSVTSGVFPTASFQLKKAKPS